MGPKVPTAWSSKSQTCSLYIRDTTFIKGQIQTLREAFPATPDWCAYYEDSSLIMADKVWESAQIAQDPTKVEIPALGGKELTSSTAEGPLAKKAKFQVALPLSSTRPSKAIVPHTGKSTTSKKR
ncbi:hypothetical protein LIER_42169 [Lithospermum erythrorhizon]|uniref:Uncharacterized protein n=1 Tax=Lithospermum erythrorhizon TaxID=34254 RepID=A0AAV3RLM5_LITER